MSNINFKSFMVDSLKTANATYNTMTFKGVDTFKDADGTPVPLEFKALSKKEISALRQEYTTRKPAKGKKGNYIISNGQLVYDETFDADGFNDALIAKSMVCPNLYDEDLQKFYNTYAATELLNVMFKGEDYDYVDECCSKACGFTDADDEDEKVINELKN